MSDSADALLSRFRASLKERADAVHELFETVRIRGQNDGLVEQALGELHTLKGEARVLGLEELANFAHSIEELFAEDQARDAPDTAAKAARALEAVLVALGREKSAEVGQVLAEALANLGATRQPNGKSTRSPQPGTEAPAPAPARAGASEAKPRERRFAQVEAAQIDVLCERVAELSAAFGRLYASTLEVFGEAHRASGPAASVLEDFEKCRTLLDGATSDAWTLRLTSVGPTLKELARHARRIAESLGKDVAVQVAAGEVQLERDVLHLLYDSLLHLVQNAVDHGLEPPDERGDKPAQGTLRLTAESVGPQVILTVEDDGRGIDTGRVRQAAIERGVIGQAAAESAGEKELTELLFDHGFSTRDSVNELSGRGVGLDVVRRRVESLGGDVAIDSTPGHGTRFSLSVPFAITKERLLIVRLQNGLYALPSRIVRAVLGASDLRAARSEDADTLRYDGETLPLRSLCKTLGFGASEAEPFTLIVELGGFRWALSVASLLGEHELIRRPAGPLLARSGAIGASALLDDGRVALLLDLNFLGRALRNPNGLPAPAPAPARGARRRQRVLAVDDSPVVCALVSEILMSAGLDVRIVHDGAAALEQIEQYQPDLVLSDVEMPKMDGFQLVSEIRRRSQRLPVVMFTTRGSVEDRRRAVEAGANAYLVKSDFRSEALLDTVRRFLHIES